jgi:hypothetical protein
MGNVSGRLAKSATRIAGLKSKGFGDDHPKVIAARLDHEVVKAEVEIEKHVETIVADWPQLTDQQLDRIAGLLRSTRGVPEPSDRAQAVAAALGQLDNGATA